MLTIDRLAQIGPSASLSPRLLAIMMPAPFQMFCSVKSKHPNDRSQHN
jgi:hypothetical protein